MLPLDHILPVGAEKRLSKLQPFENIEKADYWVQVGKVFRLDLSGEHFRPSAWFQVQIKLSPNSSFNHIGRSVKLLLCGTALAKFERVKGNADAILVYDSQKMQASIAIQKFWLNEITKERDPILNFSDLIINLRKQDVSRMST